MFSRRPQSTTLTDADSAHSQATVSERIGVSSTELIGLRQAGATLSLNRVKALTRDSGGSLSRLKGRGMEFDEVRPYEPGDDVRSLDWRVTARTGRPHTKLFREERERSVLLWVDYRAPMHFATRGRFKSVLAARAAAMLAWSVVQHGDRLGGLIFSENSHLELRPKRGRRAALDLIHNLCGSFPHQPPLSEISAQQEAVSHALARLRRVARPGSLLFLLSDFRAIDETAESHLIQLAKHNELVMLFLHDRLEQELPPAGWYRLSNGNHALSMNTASPAVRQAHMQHFQHHEQQLRNLCRRAGMHLLSCATDEDPLALLQQGLGGGRS